MPKPTEPHDDAIHDWFELSYSQFLTIPRLVMQSMPAEWQAKMVDLLNELDETFDWRPEQGTYWVSLALPRNDGDDDEPPVLVPVDHAICDYRRGSVEHLRIKPAPADPYAGMCAPGTHRWTSRLVSTPDVHEWETWCDECGCQYDPREPD